MSRNEARPKCLSVSDRSGVVRGHARPYQALSALVTVCCGPPLAVQTAQAAEAGLEEVIVTAERREQNLQDAPVSLEALNTEALQKMGATGLADITNAVPNLRQITWSVGNSTLRFYIRGVGQTDSQLTADSPVGVYLDGVYVARTSGLALSIPDLERVEVLRGPQGALYGRNTTGGAINLITKRPGKEFSFSETVRVGNYSAFKSSTVVNMPVTDSFATKFSLIADKRNGTTKNLGVGGDFNEWDNKAVRIDARWTPADNVTVDYGFDHANYTSTADLLYLDTVSSLFKGVLPEQKHRLDAAKLPSPVKPSETRGLGHAVTVAVDTAIGQIKSISAYRSMNFNAYQDQSANSFLNIFRNVSLNDSQHQFSEEVQLLGETADKAFNHTTGLYYFKESGEERANDEIGLIGLESPRHLTATNTSYAVYTTWGWRPGGVSPWSLTLGGRYTKDKRQAHNFIIPPVNASYTKFTPSAVLDYRLSDDASVYAKVATGYNAGGYNMRAADFAKDFGPESLVSYEVGMKSEFLDHRLRINGALFYSDYKDIQFTIKVPNQPDPAFNETLNAGKSDIYGAELDLTYLLTDNLQGSLSYGYLDSKYKEVPLGDSTDRYHAANAPRNSVRSTLDWTLAKLAAGDLDLYVDYTWQDPTHTSPRDDYPGSDMIPSYGIADAQLKFGNIDTGRGQLNLALWIKNMFDKEYFVDSANVFQLLHSNRLVRYGDPRTYGVEVGYKF